MMVALSFDFDKKRTRITTHKRQQSNWGDKKDNQKKDSEVKNKLKWSDIWDPANHYVWPI